jgi:hypothetical protein
MQVLGGYLFSAVSQISCDMRRQGRLKDNIGTVAKL